MLPLLSKFSKHRRLWAALLVLVVVFLIVPNLVSAQLVPNPTAAVSLAKGVVSKLTPNFMADVAQGFITKSVFLITWLASLIAGVVISIETWFLQIILDISLNGGLVNSAPVRIGFPIVLGFANLFFVGGLIVIAIATIIRQEEYGMKKVLWKLVVMAVLVNFGLVICGTLLSISDQTAKFFLQSISRGNNGASGTDDIGAFASHLVDAFNPRAVILKSSDTIRDPQVAAKDLGFVAESGDTLGNAVRPIISVLSTLGSFVIIIITLGTLIAMLLWRYIRLGMALIVLPLAWAAWIFPTYHEHYKKWWTKFTQWTIFPPAVLFFLWLGLKISEVMRQQSGEFVAFNRSSSTDPLFLFLGKLFTPIISETLKSFILFGIMMGGMVAAQELGVKFADAGYKAIEGAGGWAQGKAMNYGKRSARRTYQAAGGRIFEDALARSRFAPIANLGRGIQGFTQKAGRGVVDEEKKKLHLETAEDFDKFGASGSELPQQMAAAQLAAEKGRLGKQQQLGGKSLLDWFKANHRNMEDYGQHKLLEEFAKIGLTAEAVNNIGKGKYQNAAEDKGGILDKVEADKANRLFAKSLYGMDAKKAQPVQTALIRGMKSRFTPQQFSDMVAKFDAEQLENFNTLLRAEIEATAKKNNKSFKEAAEEIIGPNIMNAMLNNGGVRTRGVRSEEAWGEKGKAQNEVDLSQQGQGQQAQTQSQPQGEKSEPSSSGGGGSAGDHGGGGGSSTQSSSSSSGSKH